MKKWGNFIKMKLPCGCDMIAGNIYGEGVKIKLNRGKKSNIKKLTKYLPYIVGALVALAIRLLLG